MKRGRILVPNLITAFGLACGLFVIFKVNMVEPGYGDYDVVKTSAILLFVAALADFVDGALARAIRGETEFGFVFDSLADAVSFGVAPSVLMLKTLFLEQGSFLSFFSATGAMVYSLCGILRLVRFSVKSAQAKEERDQELQAAQKRNFTGLPIPAAAAAAISANLFFLSPIFSQWVDLSNANRSILLSTVMIVLGYLMVCRLKFPSLKMLHLRVPSFHIAFLVVVFAIFVLYGILYFFAEILAIICWSYIALSLTLSLIRLIAGKKSKTLADFEPEPDDFDDFAD